MSLKNPVTPPVIDPRTFRQVAQRLNHYATPVEIRDSQNTPFWDILTFRSNVLPPSLLLESKARNGGVLSNNEQRKPLLGLV